MEFLKLIFRAAHEFICTNLFSLGVSTFVLVVDASGLGAKHFDLARDKQLLQISLHAYPDRLVRAVRNIKDLKGKVIWSQKSGTPMPQQHTHTHTHVRTNGRDAAFPHGCRCDILVKRGRKKLLIFAHTFHHTSLTGRTDCGAAQRIYSHHLRSAIKFDAQAVERQNRDVQEFEDVR